MEIKTVEEFKLIPKNTKIKLVSKDNYVCLDIITSINEYEYQYKTVECSEKDEVGSVGTSNIQDTLDANFVTVINDKIPHNVNIA